MKFLIILNDPPYGTERSYNGLRLAGNLVTKHEQAEVDVFLMGDAVSCAKSGQTTPNGYYNLERMLKPVLRRGRVLLCGSCMEARGLKEAEMAEGARRSTLDELAQLTVAADKVIVF
ncbi:DsrE/DsrF/TusD sulfur relay family protein [Anaeromyxobacter sp. Fw109-5]|uniref:DsrE/DsrF/TusD sulfur relay family protein n=1 Tax=Anaeromyxobacter sp. (strain Fw109-5) TaxID=404589 RepID=UPI0000ED8ABB|nr:DsrE family protein [Anaeromyxobacter sp. Fw109-5]ABS27454.1 DsrE family protein [Anaeromyxobacter sp. Fw109-5]